MRQFVSTRNRRICLIACTVIISIRVFGYINDPGRLGPDIREEHVKLDEQDAQWLASWLSLRSLDGQLRSIEVKVESGNAIDGLGIDMSESQVRTSTTFNELYLKGRLINEDDDRVQSVTAMMEWLDESGRTIGLNEVAFRKKYHAPLHRGDRSVFGARYEVPVRSSVRIRDVVVHRVPTESRVGPGEVSLSPLAD